MPHPLVIARNMGTFVHIFIDGGPTPICDGCEKDCTDVKIGARFGRYAVCLDCAFERIKEGEYPDEISRDNETFNTFCDRLNAPLRAKMDRLHAETN